MHFQDQAGKLILIRIEGDQNWTSSIKWCFYTTNQRISIFNLNLTKEGGKSKLKGQNEQMSIQENTKQKHTTLLPQTAR